MPEISPGAGVYINIPVFALKLTVPSAVPPAEPAKRFIVMPPPAKKSSFAKMLKACWPVPEITKLSFCAVGAFMCGSVLFGLPSPSQSPADQPGAANV